MLDLIGIDSAYLRPVRNFQELHGKRFAAPIDGNNRSHSTAFEANTFHHSGFAHPYNVMFLKRGLPPSSAFISAIELNVVPEPPKKSTINAEVSVDATRMQSATV